MKQYAMVVEVDRCIGCKGGCQVACKTENEVALGRSRSTLYHMGPTGVYPDLQMYFLPVMCNSVRLRVVWMCVRQAHVTRMKKTE